MLMLDIALCQKELTIGSVAELQEGLASLIPAFEEIAPFGLSCD